MLKMIDTFVCLVREEITEYVKAFGTSLFCVGRWSRESQQNWTIGTGPFSMKQHCAFRSVFCFSYKASFLGCCMLWQNLAMNETFHQALFN